MTLRLMVRALVCTALLSLLHACSPAMNWRKTPVAGVAFNLPCKPDSAVRDQRIGAISLSLSMTGCEADGALFAISHLEVPANATGTAVQQDWQGQILQTLGASSPQPVAWRAPGGGVNAVSVIARGKSPQNRDMQARLTWFQRGNTLYHLAIYAPLLAEEWTFPFLEDISIP
jgi:hypothetical protein